MDTAKESYGGTDISLTTAQREAVFFGEGPLLVVAGAGTGKTTCLARRVARLITSGRADTGEVLVLTFSNKAAQEMEERIDILLPYAFSDIWVSTFHSFGQRILGSHALEAGLSPHFRVLTPEEMVLFIKERLFDLPLDLLRPSRNPTGHLRALARLVSRLKDEDISPEAYGEFARGLPTPDGNRAAAEKKALHLELSAFYGALQALMTESGFLDMADLVYMTLQVFRNHPLLADEYRKKFKYVLVDEFQDTNHCQYQLLKLLAAGRRNITVVGDDDQSIYRFRGAAISNILSFQEDYPDARLVVLNENFRSPGIILDAAYRLICHNNPYRLEVKSGINKHLKGREDEGAVLRYRLFDNLETQAREIAALVAKKKEEGFGYRDMAVLIRANKDADAITRQLNLADIPHQYQGSSGLYQRPEVRMLISFFRALCRPDDSMSLYSLAASGIFGVDGQSLTRLSRAADLLGVPMEEIFRGLDDENPPARVPPKALQAIKQVISCLDGFRELAPSLTAGRLLYEFLSRTGWLGRLARREVDKAEEKTRNIARFFDRIKGFEDISRHPFALPFITHLEDLIEAGEDPEASAEEEEEEAVRILTVHKAKGLEFPVVIIAGLAEGNFPSRGRSQFPDVPDEMIKERVISPDFHVQEERRLFYVAMTRSKKELYLMGARDFGGKRLRKVSRFMMEALDMPLKDFSAPLERPEDAISLFAPSSRPVRRQETASGRAPSLTYMHFDDYLTCPLKYKYVHVMRIPVLRHHLVVYGKAVRQAVLDFLRREAEGIPACREDLLTVFAGEWTKEGFLSQEHEKIRREEGEKALSAFYYNFHGKIRKDDRVDREYRFSLGEVVITGRWDMLRTEPDGTVIMDFRSSQVHDAQSADRKARESIKNQVALLSYQKMHGHPPLRLETHFLDSGIRGVVRPSPDRLEALEKTLNEAAAGIASGMHDPLPEYHKCSRCAYMAICPATAIEI
jgi:DNA helicase-2/ATP-dependent DNA helicase PcrA